MHLKYKAQILVVLLSMVGSLCAAQSPQEETAAFFEQVKAKSYVINPQTLLWIDATNGSTRWHELKEGHVKLDSTALSKLLGLNHPNSMFYEGEKCAKDPACFMRRWRHLNWYYHGYYETEHPYYHLVLITQDAKVPTMFMSTYSSEGEFVNLMDASGGYGDAGTWEYNRIQFLDDSTFVHAIINKDERPPDVPCDSLAQQIRITPGGVFQHIGEENFKIDCY